MKVRNNVLKSKKSLSSKRDNAKYPFSSKATTWHNFLWSEQQLFENL